MTRVRRCRRLYGHFTILATASHRMCLAVRTIPLRGPALICVVGLTLLGTALPASASPAPKAWLVVRDARERFVISVPAAWTVKTYRDEQPGGIVLAATGPGPYDPYPNLTVSVSDRFVPVQEWARQDEPSAYTDFTVLREGPSAIGGYPAYYRYATFRLGSSKRSLYYVQLYVRTPKHGFAMTGRTVNTADHVRRDVPVLTQIVSSLRPTGK